MGHLAILFARPTDAAVYQNGPITGPSLLPKKTDQSEKSDRLRPELNRQFLTEIVWETTLRCGMVSSDVSLLPACQP